MPEPIERTEEEKIFNRVYAELEEAEKDEEQDNTSLLYGEFITPLGERLGALFQEYERDRRLVEERWLKDLRQYRGEYDPKTRKKLHPKRSKAFLSITRTKVKTVSARQTDLLFPANGDKNWGIRPTPTPELNPNIIENIIIQYQEQTGMRPSEEQVRKWIVEEAERRADAMEKEMADQLSELKYRHIIRQTIFDGNLYGTGILKGPLTKTQKVKRWLPNEGDDPSADEWVPVEFERILPYCENVSIWDVYPDMSARRPEDMRGVFQRYIMNRNKVYELSKREDFNGEAIRAYLEVHRFGDAEYKVFEQDLKSINDATESETTVNQHESSGPAYISRKGKYELKEYWGYLSSAELKEAGVEIDDSLGLDVAVNIWLLGPIVIKAMVSPIEGVDFPFHFYYYDKDDSSIWGEGIPSIMRDAQKLFNAAVRAMLDNAAISAGPIVEANMDLLSAKENPKDLYPFRVFLRDGTGQEAAAAAVRVYSMPSYTNEFMSMIEFFMNASDEVTAIPRYMYGDTNQIGGAGKTATGLSMLMGAANVTLKDQVKNFDDGITMPFIKGLYFWNMEYNTKEHIKGDFNIVARGSTSLIAREVKAESLREFMQVTANDIDLRYLRRDNTLREYTKVLDLDELDLIKDSNTVAIEDKQRAEAEAKEQAFLKNLAMLKASSGGHMKSQEGQPQRPEMESLSMEELQSGEIPAVEGG